MGAQTETVGGEPTSQLGKDFTSFLGQSLGGVNDFVSQLLSGEGGIAQKILQGVGTPGFDLESEFGQAFLAEQGSRRATDKADLNARFGVGGPGGVGGGLAFGTGAARLTNELDSTRSRADDLAVGQLNEQALMRDFQALLGLGGLQSGVGNSLIGASNFQTGLATPQAQTIQTGGIGDILGAFTGIAQGLSPFSGFLGNLDKLFGGNKEPQGAFI
jgi:hypothetical protein